MFFFFEGGVRQELTKAYAQQEVCVQHVCVYMLGFGRAQPNLGEEFTDELVEIGHIVRKHKYGTMDACSPKRVKFWLPTVHGRVYSDMGMKFLSQLASGNLYSDMGMKFW